VRKKERKAALQHRLTALAHVLARPASGCPQLACCRLGPQPEKRRLTDQSAMMVILLLFLQKQNLSATWEDQGATIEPFHSRLHSVHS